MDTSRKEGREGLFAKRVREGRNGGVRGGKRGESSARSRGIWSLGNDVASETDKTASGGTPKQRRRRELVRGLMELGFGRLFGDFVGPSELI